MGDAEEVMEMAKKLDMNPLEQKKYKHHLEIIRINQTQTKKWKTMNYFWQLLFFGSVFIMGFRDLFLNLANMKVIDVTMGLNIVEFIEVWFGRLFWFLLPISFPLMMWSGIVRSKWDGKLTRSTAYCLSFLENIEHRQFLEEKKKVLPLGHVKATPRVTAKAKPRMQVRGPPRVAAHR